MTIGTIDDKDDDNDNDSDNNADYSINIERDRNSDDSFK